MLLVFLFIIPEENHADVSFSSFQQSPLKFLSVTCFINWIHIWDCLMLAFISLNSVPILEQKTFNTSFYKLYCVLLFLAGISVVIADLLLFVGCLRAAGFLHENILSNVLFSPMAFFDQTPVGRLLNRFGKDVEVLDFRLVENIESCIMCLLRIISVPIVIILNTPIFIVVCIPLFVLYIIVQVW